ncbi:hypothetical protein FQV39_11825 [Bosea sp. F3-2]|nr:hypothetical protein FQV39_11825 [Bosea sp. F3-2]
MTSVPLAALRGATRGRQQVALARQVAMYLAHVTFGLSLTRVGTCFGRDRTTVRHACALVEDRRDDLRLECGLNALEAALLALMNRLEHRTEKWNPLFGEIRCLNKGIDRHFASDRTRGDRACRAGEAR